jgi:hypothetical protein
VHHSPAMTSIECCVGAWHETDHARCAGPGRGLDAALAAFVDVVGDEG